MGSPCLSEFSEALPHPVYNQDDLDAGHPDSRLWLMI
jgi:hypothetical protein